MKLLIKTFAAALVTICGCNKSSPTQDTSTVAASDKPVPSSSSSAEIVEVQFFNERVLGTRGTDQSALLLPASDSAWSPKFVQVDLEDTLCYGATVFYPKRGTFEDLRSAVNARFKKWESSDFAANPTMGLWRIEDAGFAIQLNDEVDSYSVLYIRFAETAIVNRKIDEAFKKNPELFRSFMGNDEETKPANEASDKYQQSNGK